jgi:hypothetical protein
VKWENGKAFAKARLHCLDSTTHVDISEGLGNRSAAPSRSPRRVATLSAIFFTSFSPPQPSGRLALLPRHFRPRRRLQTLYGSIQSDGSTGRTDWTVWAPFSFLVLLVSAPFLVATTLQRIPASHSHEGSELFAAAYSDATTLHRSSLVGVRRPFSPLTSRLASPLRNACNGNWKQGIQTMTLCRKKKARREGPRCCPKDRER